MSCLSQQWERQTSWGWRRSRRDQACLLKSRYKESLSLSRRSSSCHLFSVSGMKTQLKAQDVGCRQPLSFCTHLTAIIVWVLAGRTCYGIPASPLFPLSRLFGFLLSYQPQWFHLFRHTTTTLPRLLLTLCLSVILPSNHHLEIYPVIKSFSRNLAPLSWNARWSRSGRCIHFPLSPMCRLSCSWQTKYSSGEDN